MAKSVSQDRREVFYPDPVYKRLLQDVARVTGKSKSSIINRAVREMIDKTNKEK